ncbi:hypothetical protein [Lewinella sp. IMCC34183]|uniref:hypothetical protein n=1 Tax=Lewinella sp. IMCC34183 TaxID=2248762 RepID=UPI00130097B3|nr:hypothetical protein [Lewinella sp. IMCC34183]
MTPIVRCLPPLLLLLTWGCANVSPGPPPADLGELGIIVAELQLAEAIAAEVPVIVRDSMQKVYYDSVLAEHGYTRESFDSIMWIIRDEPVWIDSVFTRAGEVVARDMAEM